MPIIQTDACKCSVCGYVWIPGQWRKIEGFPLPTYCAGCKSARWNGADGGQVKESPVKPVVELIVEPKVEQPIVERKVTEPRAPKAKNPPWKEVKAPAGKKKICPHGFLIDRGATACVRCS